jgi:hypothetical protein
MFLFLPSILQLRSLQNAVGCENFSLVRHFSSGSGSVIAKENGICYRSHLSFIFFTPFQWPISEEVNSICNVSTELDWGTQSACSGYMLSDKLFILSKRHIALFIDILVLLFWLLIMPLNIIDVDMYATLCCGYTYIRCSRNSSMLFPVSLDSVMWYRSIINWVFSHLCK